jgi:hypothetical protein
MRVCPAPIWCIDRLAWLRELPKPWSERLSPMLTFATMALCAASRICSRGPGFRGPTQAVMQL